MRYRISSRRGFTLIQCVVVLLIFAVIAGMLMAAVMNVRRPAQRSHDEMRLYQLREAMFNYYSSHQGIYFPAACASDKEGNPPYSWRVALLPYIEQHELWNNYNFSEPWDGPSNQRLHAPLPGGYRMHDYDSKLTTTSFLAVVGESTFFPGKTPLKYDDVTDKGATIMIVENRGANIHWMDPRDLSFEEMDYTIGSPNGISSKFPNPLILTFEGRVYRLNRNVSPATLRTMLIINDGEPQSVTEGQWTE